MLPDLNLILTALERAQADLGAHVQDQPPIGPLCEARDHLDVALCGLRAHLDQLTAVTDTAHASPFEQPAEPFRTKVKVKALPQTPEQVDLPLTAVDDLTRIRGIDRGTAQRLAAVGITSFAEMAGWDRVNIDRVCHTLDLGRRVFRENWIEQAALLERTAPSALAALEPQPALHVRDRIEGASAPCFLAELEAATPPLSATLPSDDLVLIRGIDTSLEQQLREHGIYRFDTIAAWTALDVLHMQTALGTSARISGDNWIEQAALLARSVDTHHALRVRRREFDALVPCPLTEVLEKPVLAERAVVTNAEPESQSAIEPVAPPQPPEPARATSPPPASVLDRLAALEVELAALAANDKLAPEPAPRPERVTKPPGLPRKTDASAQNLGYELHIEDEPFPELSVEEADVRIVPRGRPALRPEPQRIAVPSSRTLTKRLERMKAGADPEGEGYTVARSHVEEASVEIVRRRDEPSSKTGPNSG